jgi:hypothetical protein
MLPIRKWRRGLYSLFILTLLSAIAPPVASADDEVPAGFKADRYQKVWERNPFTLVTQNADPKKADVVLSNGAEQGSVKFRLEMPVAGPQVSGGQQPPGTATGAQNKVPGAAPGVPIPPGPGVPRQMQMPQNAKQALQQAARVGAAQMQQGAAPTQLDNGTMPPRSTPEANYPAAPK